MIHRKLVIMVMATLLFVIFSTPGFTQEYPTKVIRLISPYPPGGGNDTFCRTISPMLSNLLGQKIIIDNRPGSNTIIGTKLLVNSAPDGYTLILLPTGFAVNQSLYKDLPYNAVRDFSPISLVGSSPMLLVVSPSLPVKSMRELISLARSKPGELTYSSAGNGSNGHLSGVLFANMAGIKLQHIPYRGTAASITAVMNGEVTMSFGTMLGTLPHVRAGRLIALGMTGTKRSPAVPDIPTIAELGLTGYSSSLWYGIVAPGNTPKAIVKKLNAAIVKVINHPSIREKLAKQGVDAETCTPEEFKELIANDVEKWAKVVKEAGVKID